MIFHHHVVNVSMGNVMTLCVHVAANVVYQFKWSVIHMIITNTHINAVVQLAYQ